MTDCPLCQNCAFFNGWLVRMPKEAAFYRVKFCGSDFENCARFQVHAATGIKHPTLLPDENDRVKNIISELNYERAAKSGQY
ncbi:hypothetical protein GOV07_04325 [Candidatus Woesearchaeota archaeon]|nr:hypothetical protein [Candidatus Woesearchaeota archaeon]